jgi:tape measure domain-containing protein
MATDVEKLVVQLSAQFDKFERELAKANGVATKQFNAIERKARQMNKNLDGILGQSFKGLTAPLAGIGSAIGLREIVRLADTWTELKSRVDLAAGSMANGESVMGRLSEMARRTYSGLEQTAESWLSNATALKELGLSTNQQLDLVETLNNALVISAAKGDRAASVMNAWSKAMALGKLSGDNLNTVVSTGGRLAQALADSMGVSVNQLRQLGTDGKITAKEMAGVTSQLEKLRKEADSMQATVGDAMQLLRDAMLQYVGGADQASQMSAKLAQSIITVADNFGTVADTALQLATVIAGALTGRAILGLIGTLPAAIGGVTALVTALRAGTLTAAGFTAALGPVGLALGAAAAALALYATHQSEADFVTGKLTAAIDLNSQALETGRDASGKYTQALRDQIAMQVEAARAAWETADAAFVAATKTAAAFAVMTGFRATPLDFNVEQKDRAAADALALLDKLEAQLRRIDEAGVSKIKPASSGTDDDGTKKRADEYERLAQRIADSTATMVAETEVRRQLNPLVDDYGYAVAKARAEQDLLNAALTAGKEVTPELRAQIGGLADQYALATVEAAKLAESQDEIRRRAEEVADFQKDLTRGIVDGFIEGKKAADIFADAISKLGNKLLDLAFDGLFDIKSGGALIGRIFNLNLRRAA